MMPSLPAGIRAKVAAAIEALGLDRPDVTELAGGAANRSFRLQDGRHDFVIRLASGATALLGAHRESEIAMQALAAGAGLAPQIVLVDRGLDMLVTRYVTGDVPDRAGLGEATMLRRVGAWLARLHALAPPPGLPVVDFGERAAGYLAGVQSRKPSAFTAEIIRRLEARRARLPGLARLAACHHDLHHRNFVDTGDSLVAIDWEYAGPGDPAADLASFIGYHELDPARIEFLLAGYGVDTPALRARIESLGWIFDCLWWGWNAAAGLAGLEVDPLLQSRLGARLAA